MVFLADASQPAFSAAAYVAATPRNTAAPVVSGTLRVDRTLAASSGTWSPRPTSLAYQWLRDGRAVRGATGRTLRLGARDAGRRIAVRVTARTSGGGAAATSRALRVR